MFISPRAFSDSHRMSALQISIADTQTPLKQRLHPAHNSISVLGIHTALPVRRLSLAYPSSSVYPTPTPTGYYGQAYRKPELIRPYLQAPQLLMCTHREQNKAGWGC